MSKKSLTLVLAALILSLAHIAAAGQANVYRVGVIFCGEAGGLMSYGPNRRDLYRRTTLFVDKILEGAKPADLPIEQPKKLELIINLKAAKQIDVTIPPNLLARADKVINEKGRVSSVE